MGENFGGRSFRPLGLRGGAGAHRTRVLFQKMKMRKRHFNYLGDSIESHNDQW